MVTVLAELPKNGDSPKLAILKRRPELPCRLFREAILKDKIQNSSSFESSFEEQEPITAESNVPAGGTVKKRETVAGRTDRVNAVGQPPLMPFDVGKKITLKSFEFNSWRPSKPTNRLFRNHTVSGFFVQLPVKRQEASKETKTCKVQPICISSVPRDSKQQQHHYHLSKSFTLDSYSAEERQSEISEAERKLSSGVSNFVKRNRLQRSDSDAGPKLRFFTLRKPKTIDCKENQVRQGCDEAKNGGGGDDDDRGDDKEGGNDEHETDRSQRSGKSSTVQVRPRKPTTLLLRQDSMDLAGTDEALLDSRTDAKGPELSTNFRQKQHIQSSSSFFRSRTCEALIKFPAATVHGSNGGEERRALDQLEGPSAGAASDRETYVETLRDPTSGAARTGQAASSGSPKAGAASPKPSKCSKVCKKKSVKMTSSFVRNVPAILSGLRKSLPIQISSPNSSDLSPSAEKEMKKSRVSPTSLVQNPSKAGLKSRGKSGKNSPSREEDNCSPRNGDLHLPTKSVTSSSPSVIGSRSEVSHHSSSSSSSMSDVPTPRSVNRKREGRPSITPSLETCLSNVSQFSSHSDDVDKRDLILKEFLISEKQYVETLRMLVEKYMLPLKTQDIVDSGHVDEAFYKIQEIYVHHATLITFLAKALNRWSDRSTVGDVIYKNFSKETVIESYVSFIEHFPRAEKALQELLAKSSFQKFIEQCEKETKMKLPLKAQLVKPAQRIPRYELLLKRLLENTPLTHPDYPLLKQAESAIHDLALRINEVNKDGREEEGQVATLKKLELLLITDLVSPGRYYVRNDMVTMRDPSKDRHCCLWFFSDLLLFSFVKRKNSGICRKATLLLRSVAGNDFVENVKHKSWLKIPLKNVSISYSTLSQNISEKAKVKEQLQNDHQTLNQIADLTNRLKCTHFSMDEAVEDVAIEIGRKLKEVDTTCLALDKEHNLTLQLSLPQEGLQHLHLTFATAEKQMNWELSFIYYKNKLDAR